MCYIIAKRFKKSGCIALKAKRGKELAAYGEYEPYHFVNSFEEFSKEASLL